MKKFYSLIYLILLFLVGCASGREFWNYVVEEPVRKPQSRESGEVDSPNPSNSQVVKVSYNDGTTTTEVQIPVLTTGQQIVIDHKGRPSEKSLSLIPLPPTEADKSLEDSYLKNGNPIAQKATPVSIVKTQAEIQKLAKQGNYALALEYATQLLQRYPNHVETLRTKGALLLKMGEKDAALDAYQKAQDIQPNSRVQKQMDSLQKELGN